MWVLGFGVWGLGSKHPRHQVMMFLITGFDITWVFTKIGGPNIGQYSTILIKWSPAKGAGIVGNPHTLNLINPKLE